MPAHVSTLVLALLYDTASYYDCVAKDTDLDAFKVDGFGRIRAKFASAITCVLVMVFPPPSERDPVISVNAIQSCHVPLIGSSRPFVLHLHQNLLIFSPGIAVSAGCFLSRGAARGYRHDDGYQYRNHHALHLSWHLSLVLNAFSQEDN